MSAIETHLRSVTSVGSTILGEHGLQLAQRLLGNSITNTIIGINSDGRLVSRLGVDELDLNRNNLILELSCLLCENGFLEGTSGESILLLTSNVVLLGDVLTCECGSELVEFELGCFTKCSVRTGDSHGKQAVGGSLDGEDFL